MKNNHPKLKWWHKGALVGLGLGAVSMGCMIYFGKSIAPGDIASGYGLLFLVELPVFPIFWLLLIILSRDTLQLGFLLAHFISWIIGGVFYVGIFRWLTKDSQKNKKQ